MNDSLKKEYDTYFSKFYIDFYKYQTGSKKQLNCPHCSTKKRFIFNKDQLIFSCGPKHNKDKKCGVQYTIDLPKYINFRELFELMKNKDGRSKTISYHRIIDALIILSLCFYFYYNIIIKHRYELKHFITFIIIAILSLTIDNVLENFTYEKNFYLFFSFFNILFIHFFTPFTKIIESK